MIKGIVLTNPFLLHSLRQVVRTLAFSMDHELEQPYQLVYSGSSIEHNIDLLGIIFYSYTVPFLHATFDDMPEKTEKANVLYHPEAC